MGLGLGEMRFCEMGGHSVLSVVLAERECRHWPDFV